MKRMIRVNFSKDDKDYLIFLCKGWWCDECRLKFMCFTLKEDELEIYCTPEQQRGTVFNGIPYFELNRYEGKAVAVWLGLRLFGRDSAKLCWIKFLKFFNGT